MAFWDYCEDCVKYVFGGSLTDAADEKILRKLETGPLTDGEIRRLVFGDNKPSEWITEKMAALEQLRRVRRCEKEFKRKTWAAWELVA